MIIQVIEHEALVGNTNTDLWAIRSGHSVRRTFIHAGEELPPHGEYDLLLVAGGPQHVWQEEAHPWLSREKSYILEAIHKGKAVLGLCLGGQLVAEQLGAEVFQAKQPEVGWHEVTVSGEAQQGALFGSDVKRFTTFHWHSAQFTLPPDCVNLASSEATPVQGFASSSRPVVGLQFHPEYTREMVQYYARREGEDHWHAAPYVHTARQTLERTAVLPDTYPRMASILDFIVVGILSGSKPFPITGRASMLE